MDFDFYLVFQYGERFMNGLWFTVHICTLAVLMGMAIGLVVAALDGIRFRPLRWLCRAYIELMRGTPILILLFILYYALPDLGIRLSAYTVGVVGLGIYAGGYFAEIFRGGFNSIPRGQIEAARTLGLSSHQIITRIKIPQMLVLIIPPSVNQIIIIIKESALLSIITIPELTMVTSQMASETFRFVEPYIAVAVLYWIVIETVSRFGRWVETRAKRYL